MNSLKLLTRRDWILIALFCFAMFIAADSASIRGGVCAVSPCSTLNQSFIDDGTVDHYFKTVSNPYISPTAALSYSYFKKDPALIFGLDSQPYQFQLDAKESMESRIPSQLLRDDKRLLSRVYLIHEFFVLLSLPIWFGLALFVRIISKRKTPFGRAMRALFWLLSVFAVALILLRLFGDMFGGESDDTLQMLFP
jgi:hypothetical protein